MRLRLFRGHAFDVEVLQIHTVGGDLQRCDASLFLLNICRMANDHVALVVSHGEASAQETVVESTAIKSGNLSSVQYDRPFAILKVAHTLELASEFDLVRPLRPHAMSATHFCEGANGEAECEKNKKFVHVFLDEDVLTGWLDVTYSTCTT